MPVLSILCNVSSLVDIDDRLQAFLREIFKGWLDQILDATEELKEYFEIPMR